MHPREISYFPKWGEASVRVAVLDGYADLEHPCFHGANVRVLQGPAVSASVADETAAHGTHVTSVLFGQHGSEVDGLVPNCSGFVIPIFSNESRSVSQLDLSRAIEQAVEEGAHVINISGGQLTDFGEADVWLRNAIQLCCDRNILVIAAAGNDGCECLHVPAALPNVLAVGAVDRQGRPMDFSNWSEALRSSGVMAPGEQILGARPGGGTVRADGTSFATPLVAGAAALLLSLQVGQGQTPDPLAIRQLLLDTALPCQGAEDASRCLAGTLNLPGAFDALTGSKQMTYQSMARANAVAPQCACEDADKVEPEPNAKAAEIDPQIAVSPSVAAPISSGAARLERAGGGGGSRAGNYAQGALPSSVTPDDVANADGLVFAIGVLGYDFGTEARRDSFKQLMQVDGEPPRNPYDARQMHDYLAASGKLSNAEALIWTLNIELTPVYAVEPVGPFAAEVYKELVDLLGGEVLLENDAYFIERVSIPGLLTGRTVKLFSGQVVPTIQPPNTRGIYGWRTNALVEEAMKQVDAAVAPALAAPGAPVTTEAITAALSDFLNRIYYDLRNLGKTSHDRALNYAATHAFQDVRKFADSLKEGRQLDEITVEKSPFGRMDSDCWDVKLKFFDPENDKRAKRILRYTIDVSDLIPIVLGEPRTWTQAN